jgi:hypothetical protein
MSETKRDYEVGRGKPPVRSRFKKGQSGSERVSPGDPRGPRPRGQPALLVDEFNDCDEARHHLDLSALPKSIPTVPVTAYASDGVRERAPSAGVIG